jgi:hypothetical protein
VKLLKNWIKHQPCVHGYTGEGSVEVQGSEQVLVLYHTNRPISR